MIPIYQETIATYPFRSVFVVKLHKIHISILTQYKHNKIDNEGQEGKHLLQFTGTQKVK